MRSELKKANLHHTWICNRLQHLGWKPLRKNLQLTRHPLVLRRDDKNALVKDIPKHQHQTILFISFTVCHSIGPGYTTDPLSTNRTHNPKVV